MAVAPIRQQTGVRGVQHLYDGSGWQANRSVQPPLTHEAIDREHLRGHASLSPSTLPR